MTKKQTAYNNNNNYYYYYSYRCVASSCFKTAGQRAVAAISMFQPLLAIIAYLLTIS
jgi:hypothetical protein